MAAIQALVGSKIIDVSWADEPVIQPIPSAIRKPLISLAKDFHFVVVTEVNLNLIRNYYVIPKGFVSDGGSIPRLAWTAGGITPFDPRELAAFLIHDACYVFVKLKLMERLQADEILDKALKCNAVQKSIIYRSVRVFGGSHAEGDLDDNEKKVILPLIATGGKHGNRN